MRQQRRLFGLCVSRPLRLGVLTQSHRGVEVRNVASEFSPHCRLKIRNDRASKFDQHSVAAGPSSLTWCPKAKLST